jgi:hypothetical protein
MVRHADVEPRSVVDCFSLESLPLELLGKDRHLRPKGKKLLSRSNLNFENLKSEYSRTCTWNKLGSRFYVALGRAVRKLLDRFFGLGMGRKHLGFHVAPFWPKPKVARPSKSLSETTLEWSFGMFLVRSPLGGLVGNALVATKGAGPASSASPTSKKFGFPPSPAPELTFLAAPPPARPPDPVFKFSPLILNPGLPLRLSLERLCWVRSCVLPSWWFLSLISVTIGG